MPLAELLTPQLQPRSVGSALDSLCLFGCARAGCGQTRESWKAFRCHDAQCCASQDDVIHHPPDSHAGAHVRAENTSNAPQLSSAAAVDWGIDDSSWPTADVSFSPEHSPYEDYASLGNALDVLSLGQVTRVGTAKPSTSKKTGEELKRSLADIIEFSEQGLSPGLPEFYVELQVEGNKAAESNTKDREHIRGLLDSYQTENALPQVASGKQHVQDHCGTDARNEAWHAEGYEKASTASADAVLLKFLRRLERCPQQCMRFCVGGSLLWPTLQLPEPGVCRVCGSTRTFHMQVMSPLIAMFVEAKSWLDIAEQEVTGAGQSVNVAPPDSWEWQTIGISMCPRLCRAGSERVIEEVACVCLE